MQFSITIIIIAVTVGVSLLAWNRPELMQRWIFNPFRIRSHREYHRFITSGFIHQDYMHLLFNMLTLYFFGTLIEQVYAYLYGASGPWIYVGLYLVAIVVSSITTYVKHRDNPAYNSLGASGGVSAILFAAILFDPTSTLLVFFIIPMPAFLLGALFLLYSYQQGRKGLGGINHDAHLLGALFGIAFTVALEPQVIGSFVKQVSEYSLFS
jgi:membrane associated rhomboid family serine protease